MWPHKLHTQYTVPVTSVEPPKTFSAAVFLARVYTRAVQILEKSKSKLKSLGPRCDMKHVPYWGPTNMRPVFVHPRYRTTPSSVWRQISFSIAVRRTSSRNLVSLLTFKYPRNLTSSSQICILFSVFLLALVFVNTRHIIWPSDFINFRFFVPSPIYSARTRAVLNCPLINTSYVWGTAIGRHVFAVNKTAYGFAIHRNTTYTINVCSDFMCRVLGTDIAGKLIVEMCFWLFRNWMQKQDGWWRRKSSIAAVVCSNVCIYRA